MSNSSFIAWLFGWVCCTVFFIVLYAIFPTHSGIYRQGQIDALSGKVHYELVKQSNGTVTWQRK